MMCELTCKACRVPFEFEDLDEKMQQIEAVQITEKDWSSGGAHMFVDDSHLAALVEKTVENLDVVRVPRFVDTWIPERFRNHNNNRKIVQGVLKTATLNIQQSPEFGRLSGARDTCSTTMIDVSSRIQDVAQQLRELVRSTPSGHVGEKDWPRRLSTFIHTLNENTQNLIDAIQGGAQIGDHIEATRSAASRLLITGEYIDRLLSQIHVVARQTQQSNAPLIADAFGPVVQKYVTDLQISVRDFQYPEFVFIPCDWYRGRKVVA